MSTTSKSPRKVALVVALLPHCGIADCGVVIDIGLDPPDGYGGPDDYDASNEYFVPLNNDDDNANYEADFTDPADFHDETVALVPLYVYRTDDTSTGTIKLKVTRGSSKIKIWECSYRHGLIVGDGQAESDGWAAGSVPTERSESFVFYVEGIDPSGSVGDVEIEAVWEDGPIHPDLDSLVLTVVRTDLREVTFSGSACHEVTKDDGTAFTGAQWQDNSDTPDKDAEEIVDGKVQPEANDRRYPLCFTRNTTMVATATIVVEPAELADGYVYVTATHEGGSYDFEAEAHASNGTVTITEVQCNSPLANNVEYHAPLELKWEITLGEASCRSFLCGISRNTLYVTLGAPTASPLYETPLKIGCENAHGKAEEAQVISAVWSEFTDLDVRRVDGVRMAYWAGANAVNVTSAGAILASDDGDGACGAWADLLRWCMKSQGLETCTVKQVVPWKNVFAADRSMLLRDWKFDSHVRTGPDDQQRNTPIQQDDEAININPPYDNMPCIGPGPNGTLDSQPPQGNDVVQDGFMYANPQAYKYTISTPNIVGDAIDVSGRVGQGGVNPLHSWFQRHFVCVVGDKVYDPSYGRGDMTLSAYENDVIEGFADAAGFAREQTDLLETKLEDPQ